MKGQDWKKHWEDGLNALLAVWLFISPWVLGFAATSAAASWNSYVLGVAIFAIAVLALVRFQDWEEWLNCLLGIWLIVSPWLLGYSELAAAVWNHVIVGVLVAGLAAIEIWQTRPNRQKLA